VTTPAGTAPAPPCRLFVIQARSAPRALILRRGPSDWYHLIRWDTDTDTFEHGAWLRGRIYEERCDLSPDGELLVYFALQGSRWQTSYRGAWTAVSRPPWLHALALWPQGDTWGGGGAFLADRRVALWTSSLATHPHHPATGLEVVQGRPDARRQLGFIVFGLGTGEWSNGDVRVSAGRLLRRQGGREVVLADLNGLRPDPQPAPAWARAPLGARGSRRWRRERRKVR
jgi:hypothetical protein